MAGSSPAEPPRAPRLPVPGSPSPRATELASRRGEAEELELEDIRRYESVSRSLAYAEVRGGSEADSP